MMGRFGWFVFFTMLVLLASEEMGVHVEARLCESLSRGFKGLCYDSNLCAVTCKTEGYQSGYCRGFRRRCFCQQPCH